MKIPAKRLFNLIVLASCLGHGSVNNIYRYLEKGNLDSARIHFSGFKSKYPEESVTKYLEGRLSPNAEVLFENFKWLEKNGVNDSTKEDAFFQLAHYYYLNDELGMAIYFFRKCILQNPQGKLSAKSHYWMGLTCAQYGEKKKEAYLDSAEFHFRSASQMVGSKDPIYSLSIGGISQARWLKKEREASHVILEMALENQLPQTLGTLNWLGYTQNEMAADSSKALAFGKSLAYHCPHCLETSLLDLPEEINLGPGPNKISPQKPGLALQLGAYYNRENALSFKENLKKKGIEAIVLSEDRMGTFMYLVRVPGFSSREEAEEFGEKKLTAQGLSYYLILPN